MTLVVAVLAALAAFRSKRLLSRRPAHIAAVALVVESMLVLSADWAWHFSRAAAAVVIAADFALGLVTVAALGAVARELRDRSAIISLVLWAFAWIGIGAIELWTVIATAADRHLGDMPDQTMVTPILFGLGGYGLFVTLARSISAQRARRRVVWLGRLFACTAIFVVIREASRAVQVRGWPAIDIPVALASATLAAALEIWQRTRVPPLPVAVIATDDSR